MKLRVRSMKRLTLTLAALLLASVGSSLSAQVSPLEAKRQQEAAAQRAAQARQEAAKREAAARAAARKAQAAAQRRAEERAASDALYSGYTAYKRGDFLSAVALFRKAAELGNAVAQGNLGVMYDEGQGVPEDDTLAVSWYRKAADQGYADAQSNLAEMYDRGDGVPQNKAVALSWYQKAAEQGNARAQFFVGAKYYLGDGVAQNKALAVSWYRKAADQGYVDAQRNLGFVYDNGEGVPEDNVIAVSWYRKAAEQGDASAQHNLGMMYAKGEGVPQNNATAADWYRKAAEQGNADAQKALAALQRIEQEQRLAREAAEREANIRRIEGLRAAASAAAARKDYRAASSLEWQFKGNRLAEYLSLLSKQYQTGDGMARDPICALAFAELAAKQDPAYSSLRDSARRRFEYWYSNEEYPIPESIRANQLLADLNSESITPRYRGC